MPEFPQPKSFPQGARLEDGVWAQVFSKLTETANKAALFLDRDGVVCVEANYLQHAKDVALMDGVGDVIKSANQKGIPVILVTNQAGIGYGYFGWDEFIAVQARVIDDIKAAGAMIDGVFACPFHEKGIPPYNHPSHPARKPNPAMLNMAGDLMGVDLRRSWIVGDRAKDIRAGKNAGLAGGVHVTCGHGSDDGENQNALSLNGAQYTVKSADDLKSAAKYIPLLD